MGDEKAPDVAGQMASVFGTEDLRPCCRGPRGKPHLPGCPVQAARDSFAEGEETAGAPTRMRGSIHRSHRGEGKNAV